MANNARIYQKWRLSGSDRTLSLLLRSALWLVVMLMLILPLTGFGR